MTPEVESHARVERPAAENADSRARGRKGVSLKVSEIGAVSVYGLRRAPVTLHKEQWLKLLELAAEIRAFIEEHETQLERKEQEPGQAELFEVIHDQQ